MSVLPTTGPDIALAEAVVRALADGDVLTLQRLVAPDVVDHSAASGQPVGWPGVRERAMTLCARVPDSDVHVEILSAAGDTVLVRADLVPRRTAQDGVAAPLDRHLTLVLVLRFADGLLTELWTSSDLRLDQPGRPHALHESHANAAS